MHPHVRERRPDLVAKAARRDLDAGLQRVPHHRVRDGELAALAALVEDALPANPSMLVFSITTKMPGARLLPRLIPWRPACR
jgi:hypothetical protein